MRASEKNENYRSTGVAWLNTLAARGQSGGGKLRTQRFAVPRHSIIAEDTITETAGPHDTHVYPATWTLG